MKKLILVLLMLSFLTVPASANQIVAPEIPDEVEDLFPEQQDSFSDGLWHILTSVIGTLQPQVASAAGLCSGLLAVAMLLSLLRTYEGKSKALVELASVVGVACLMMGSAKSMITLSAKTIQDISHYGRLLLPVLTAALAAQGGVTSSTALYAGTALFDSVLSTLISSVSLPAVYIFLVLSIVNAATEDGMLKKLRDTVKWALTWGMKIVLYVFTGYISLTGVISGVADRTALKATKLAISSMVPVVGSVLSDASETILVSAATVKSATGVYGLLAIIAITVTPFLTIGLTYLLLKLTVALAAVFAPKQMTGLMEDFTTAMGILSGMTGTVCLLQMISIVCFLKGMG